MAPLDEFGQPAFRYLASSADFGCIELTAGGAEWVEVNGRAGMHVLGRNTVAKLSRHTLNSDRGSVRLWLCPLDDLNTRVTPEWVERYFPNSFVYPLLCDKENGRDRWAATFIWQWDAGWYPQFYAKFHNGPVYGNPQNPKDLTSAYDHDAGFKGIVIAQHFAPRRYTWYHLTLTWDKPARDFRIYINGILAGVSERREPVMIAPTGEKLFTGNPAWVVGDIAFFDHVPTAAAVRRDFLLNGGQADSTLDHHLRHTYAGEFNPRLPPFDPSGWELAVEVPMNRAGDLELFYVQGAQTARVTDEGIRITNPVERPKGVFKAVEGESKHLPEEYRQLLAPPGTFEAGKVRDLRQSYLWLRQQTSGHARIELEFKSFRDNGLALLIAQATGVQREDFMVDDPPRTNGSMTMVCWENVRSYHWEFFRQVDDVRRDIASHAMCKNPTVFPMGLGHQQQQLALHTWHTLVWEQNGSHITCAINGEVVLQADDDPDVTGGPVFDSGRMAIRCMRATDMVFRNLKIFTRPTPLNRLATRP